MESIFIECRFNIFPTCISTSILYCRYLPNCMWYIKHILRSLVAQKMCQCLPLHRIASPHICGWILVSQRKYLSWKRVVPQGMSYTWNGMARYWHDVRPNIKLVHFRFWKTSKSAQSKEFYGHTHYVPLYMCPSMSTLEVIGACRNFSYKVDRYSYSLNVYVLFNFKFQEHLLNGPTIYPLPVCDVCI